MIPVEFIVSVVVAATVVTLEFVIVSVAVSFIVTSEVPVSRDVFVLIVPAKLSALIVVSPVVWIARLFSESSLRISVMLNILFLERSTSVKTL